MTAYQTDFVTEYDKAQLRVLFDGYADFYCVPMGSITADKGWESEECGVRSDFWR